MDEVHNTEKTIRLFIGIDFPKEMKAAIDYFLQPIHQSSKGWENPHDYHQTLLFIGSTPENQIEEIKKRLDQLVFHSFTLKTSDFKFFNRRIMYLDLIPSADLLILVHTIQKMFPEYVRENEKEFLPHITVKRWQRYEFEHIVNGLSNRHLESIKFEVKSLALFKSEKDLMGNKYHVIHRTNLQ